MRNEIKQEAVQENVKATCGREIIKIVKEFFSTNENKVMYYGEQKESLYSLYFLLKAINVNDNPDAYAIIDNKALIIEHFEFDSTYTNKKGSTNRKELARIHREFEEELQKTELKNGETFHKHDTINAIHSMENYINNALKGLKNHYDKIDNYKQNLLDEGIININTNIKTMFWIEDTTLLGNAFKSKDNNTEPLIILHCDKFLEELKKCDKLDYIFCFSKYGNEKYCWFLDLDYIQNYISEQIKVSETEIIDFKPHTTGFMTVFDGEVQNEPRNKTKN